MAAGDRSKRIRVNVQRVLGNRGETDEAGLAVAIFEAGDRIQRRIAEDALCIEASFDLDTTSGEELYQIPDGFIAERVLVTTNSTELKRIDMTELARLKRGTSSENQTDVTSGDAMYYYIWNDEIGVLLSNGGSPTGEQTITMYYWRYPDNSERLSDTKDPVVRPQWDDVIYKGIVAEFLQDKGWMVQYETAFQNAKLNDRSRQSEAMKIAVNESYD